jgi:hypothetical protein
VKPQTANPHDKPVLDEEAFQQLLSAAYVLQQHKDRLQLGDEPESGFAKTLTRLLEIQEEVRARQLDLQAAATLIVRRVREITSASGAAIGLLDDDQLEYYAASGNAAAEAGSRTPFDSTLAAECLRTGLVLQSPDAQTDQRLTLQLCHRLNVGALIAAPINQDGKVVGAFELHFSASHSFQEHDVRTCQLLAALVAEVITRNALHAEASASPGAAAEFKTLSEATAGPSFAGERASLLAALNKIKPQLERLVGEAAVPPAVPAPPVAAPEAEPTIEPQDVGLICPVCLGCGNQLEADQLFCGVCGTARPEENSDASKSTWGSLWELQRKAEKSHSGSFGESLDPDGLDLLPSELENLVAQVAKKPIQTQPSKPLELGRSGIASVPVYESPDPSQEAERNGEQRLATHDSLDLADSGISPDFGLQPPAPNPRSAAGQAARPVWPKVQAGPAASAPSTTAPKTGELPEAQRKRSAWLAEKWQSQRANVYVGAAALLLLAVLSGWLTPAPPLANPGPTVRASGVHRRKAPPKPELSFLDQLLVDLGLAEAPPPPAEAGNPDTRVWIDVHTALYYCPGSELFGKTPGGRFTTQGNAEQDAFQPATRKPCE